MLITEFIRILQDTVPLASMGFEKDAIGLQVGLDQDARIRNVLFCYEVTHEVIAEAEERDANLIVAFHPLIFPSLNSVTDSSRTGKLVRELIRSGIALYVQHTAFDAQPEFGTSSLMADVLELDNVRVLSALKQSLNKITVFAPYAASKTVMEALVGCGAGKVGGLEASSFQIEGQGQFRSLEIERKPDEPTVLEGVNEVRLEMVCERWNTSKAIRAIDELNKEIRVLYDVTPLETQSQNFGMGAIGEWERPKSREEFLEFVALAFGSSVLRYNSGGATLISKVAMLGGAGMEFYSAAKGQGAHAFVTADVRYHDFYRADHDNILLVDAGHAETERFVSRGMLRAAQKALTRSKSATKLDPEVLLVSNVEANSVRYYCRKEAR